MITVNSDRTIKSLSDYLNSLAVKCARLRKLLTEQGYAVASIRFRSAQYDGTNDVTVSLSDDGRVATVLAQGQAVCFIEFGSGIYYEQSYPMAVPAGISGIGQYGKGNGSRDYWFYTGNPGTNGVPSRKNSKAIYTHGNPPAMAMYYARNAMIEKVTQIAREVFNS